MAPVVNAGAQAQPASRTAAHRGGRDGVTHDTLHSQRAVRALPAGNNCSHVVAVVVLHQQISASSPPHVCCGDLRRVQVGNVAPPLARGGRMRYAFKM